MGGDEVTRESVKAVDEAMRHGFAAGLGQALHASHVAWTNPDWVVKTVTNTSATFVGAADLSAHYGSRWSPACTANDIEGALKTAGDGTRGIVAGEVPNRSYGHFFNVVNDGGVVRYLDGQPGAMTSPAGYSRLWLLPTN